MESSLEVLAQKGKEGDRTALEELMLDFETPFYICLGWDGNEDDVDMTFLLSVDVDVVFVPID